MWHLFSCIWSKVRHLSRLPSPFTCPSGVCGSSVDSKAWLRHWWWLGLFQDFHQHQRRLKGQKIRRKGVDMSTLVQWFLQRCGVLLVDASFISLPCTWAACSALGLFHLIRIEHGRCLAFHPPDSFCWPPSCSWRWQTFVSGVRSCSPAAFLTFRIRFFFNLFFLSFSITSERCSSKQNYVAFVHNSSRMDNKNKE